MNGIVIVYDGECPFCSSYVTLVRLRETVGQIVLLNAREDIGEIAAEIRREKLQLDEGMAVKYRQHWYHGAAAIQLLAQLGSTDNGFNKLNRWLFRSTLASRVLYPVLRFFRNLTLRLLGRKKLNNLQEPAHKRTR
ncbi:MAG: DUF393 domain-containing protein [Gammaproteobacteria bacterium]|nr:DUF393 domain-containing protein [Gammaproteobacteria bacterium]